MQFRRAAWSTETPLSWFGLNAQILGKCSSVQKGGATRRAFGVFQAIAPGICGVCDEDG